MRLNANTVTREDGVAYKMEKDSYELQMELLIDRMTLVRDSLATAEAFLNDVYEVRDKIMESFPERKEEYENDVKVNGLAVAIDNLMGALGQRMGD